jgi:hypothetical protein
LESLAAPVVSASDAVVVCCSRNAPIISGGHDRATSQVVEHWRPSSFRGPRLHGSDTKTSNAAIYGPPIVIEEDGGLTNGTPPNTDASPGRSSNEALGVPIFHTVITSGIRFTPDTVKPFLKAEADRLTLPQKRRSNAGPMTPQIRRSSATGSPTNSATRYASSNPLIESAPTDQAKPGSYRSSRHRCLVVSSAFCGPCNEN